MEAREPLLDKITRAVEDNKTQLERASVDDSRASMNFVIREVNRGTIYMGCQTDDFFYIITPEGQGEDIEYKISKYNLENTQSETAALMRDDTLLLIGCVDRIIKTFSIRKDPSNPNIGPEITVREEVTCLKPLNARTLFCG